MWACGRSFRPPIARSPAVDDKAHRPADPPQVVQPRNSLALVIGQPDWRHDRGDRLADACVSGGDLGGSRNGRRIDYRQGCRLRMRCAARQVQQDEGCDRYGNWQTISEPCVALAQSSVARVSTPSTNVQLVGTR